MPTLILGEIPPARSSGRGACKFKTTVFLLTRAPTGGSVPPRTAGAQGNLFFGGVAHKTNPETKTLGVGGIGVGLVGQFWTNKGKI